MKKIIAMALCLIMVLSLGVVATSAAPNPEEVGKVETGYTPEGTGIDSLDKITDPEGKYYLTADITVEKTLETTFKGTFDGNGKKVTVKAPMFKKVSDATVMNFVVEGELNYTEKGIVAGFPCVAPVVISAEGTTTVKNILSNVKVTSTEASTNASGLIGTAAKKNSVLTVENCVTTGDVTSGFRAGGIVAFTFYQGDYIFKNCLNTGKITAGEKGEAGGIVSKLGVNTGGTNLFENCANTGEVTSSGAQAGGLLGYTATVTSFTNCSNSGKVTANSEAGGIVGCVQEGKTSTVYMYRGCFNSGDVLSKTNKAGGIIGYTWASGSNIYVDVQGCMNTATVTGATFASQIIAYTNADATIIRNNIGTGKVAAYVADCKLAFIGCSSAKPLAYTIKDNYIVENDGMVYFSYTATEANKDSIIELAKRPEGSIIFPTADQLKSGEITVLLNDNLNSYTFRQTLGTDVTPLINETSGFVVKTSGGKYENNENPPAYTETPTEAPTTATETTKKPAPATSKPAESTKAPGTEAPGTEAPGTEAPKEGGCGSIIGSGAIVVVAALAVTFVALKKKEN